MLKSNSAPVEEGLGVGVGLGRVGSAAVLGVVAQLLREAQVTHRVGVDDRRAAAGHHRPDAARRVQDAQLQAGAWHARWNLSVDGLWKGCAIHGSPRRRATPVLGVLTSMPCAAANQLMSTGLGERGEAAASSQCAASWSCLCPAREQIEGEHVYAAQALGRCLRTGVFVHGQDALLRGGHAAAEGQRELDGTPLLAALEGGGVVQLPAHVQREWQPRGVQREGVHLQQREVQVPEHLHLAVEHRSCPCEDTGTSLCSAFEVQSCGAFLTLMHRNVVMDGRVCFMTSSW